jgi:hypothetical protein
VGGASLLLLLSGAPGAPAAPPASVDPAAWLLLCGAGLGAATPGVSIPTYLVPSVAAAGGFIDPNRTLVTRT